MDMQLARETAIEAVKEAGKLLMFNFGKVKEASFKAKSHIVTKVDTESEKVLLDKIQKNFPDHSILSEERELIDKSSRYMWVADPIDGTINYYYSAAPFRVALCLLDDKKPIISAIYNPLKDELYFAEKGKGATLNGTKISVSNNDELEKAIVMTHLSSRKEARARTILSLETIFDNVMHLRLYGSGLAAMTYIASGKFDIFFNLETYPWDILPGAILVEEAGGKVTEINGNEITFGSTSILATNGRVHGQMLKLLEDI